MRINYLITDMDNPDSDEETTQEQVYALVTLMYHEKRLHEGALLVKVNLPEMNKDF